MSIFGFFNKERVDDLPDTETGSKLIIFLGRYFSKFRQLIFLNFIYFIFNIPALFLLIYIAPSYIIPNTLESFFLTTFLKDPESLLGKNLSVLKDPNFFNNADLFIILVSVIFIVIPVITVGPAQAGLAYIIRCFTRRSPVFLWAEFKEHAFGNLRQSIIVSTINTLFLIVMCVNTQVALTSEGFWNKLFGFFSILIIILFVFMCMYIYPMMVTFKLNILNLYRNSFLFALMRFPLNLLIFALCFGLTLASFIYFELGFALLILLTFSTITFVYQYYTFGVIEKFMLRKSDSNIQQ